MSSNKRRLVIDITQLVHWSGNLTGIPRVMNEVAMRYANDASCQFVVWDTQSCTFLEVDISESLSRRGEGVFYKKQTSPPSTERQKYDAFVGKLKRIARRLKKLAPSLYEGVAAQAHQKTVAGIQRFQIEPEDCLFVLWGEWGDANYRKMLSEVRSQGTKTVQVVYDMLPLVTPQYSGHSTIAMEEYYTQAVPYCDLVLSISNHTQSDLLEWLRSKNLPLPTAKVFRLGDDFKLPSGTPKASQKIQEALGGLKNEFLLCVGTVEVRKNHTLIYYAYKQAKEKGIELPKILIAGRRGWKTDDIFDTISTDPAVKDKIIFLGAVTDEELDWLYKNCRFTVYPSFYEGWGLPIAESIAYKKTCLSSNTSSMPEVAKGLINYFSPTSSDELLEKIAQLMSDRELKRAQAKIQKYRTTTWDDTFKQIGDLIKEIYVAKN